MEDPHRGEVPFVVRAATPADATTIGVLRTEMLAVAPAAYDTDPDVAGRPPSHWATWVGTDSDGTRRTVQLAEVGGCAVGMAAAHIDPDGHCAHLGAMWVQPTHRGRGVARALLAAAETWAHRSGARTVVLGVAATNTGAARLYAAAGYTHTGDGRTTRWGDTEHTLTKNLT